MKYKLLACLVAIPVIVTALLLRGISLVEEKI